MNKKTIIVLGLLCMGGLTAGAQGSPAHATKKQQTMNATVATTKSTDVVKAFFEAFGKGDLEGLVNTFADNAQIIAVRQQQRADGGLYGNYEGKTGVRDFVQTLGQTFNTKAFSVDHIAGDGNVAFAQGHFTHEVKATGKLFSSSWALMCIVKDGKIAEYHFFEDSAAFEKANAK